MIPLRDANPTRTFPIVTVGLIALNVLVFLYQAMGTANPQAFVMTYGAIPRVVLGAGAAAYSGGPWPPLTILTSMFLHGGFFHLGGNMLYLWIFGDNLEDRMGKVRYVVFYLICGAAAAGTHILTAPSSPVPMVGASGAISGVLGGYVLLFPRAKVMTLFFWGWFTRIVPLPAVWVLGIWFLMQVLNGLPSLAFANMGGVAWFAHVGGFIAGFLLVRLFAR
ncbi:MAG: rhomboid family intramembrane serine protease [Nitrospirae bacterium]|nr:rhomboid family intramembrane serine protease [Nitrospirota bacterium]